MIKITNQITIAKPLSEVFAFVSDPTNNATWNYYVTSVEKVNDVSGVGAEYLQTRKSDKQKFHLTVYRENERCVMQTLPREKPAVRREVNFEGDEKQTIIHDVIELKVLLPSFLAKLFSGGPRKAVRQNLEKLKELLETGKVTLQDGREILLHQ